MPEDITVLWDDAAVREWTKASPELLSGLDRLATVVMVAMKAAIPVSPVIPAYANPIPAGRSKGPVYQGRGLARLAGPARSRFRAAGDLPLRPSGYLRSSVIKWREPLAICIGPTAPYASYVNDGTPPHLIRSHGDWPLRNRATGQVFGQEVHHPGTRGVHFVEKAAAAIQGQVIHL